MSFIESDFVYCFCMRESFDSSHQRAHSKRSYTYDICAHESGTYTTSKNDLFVLQAKILNAKEQVFNSVDKKVRNCFLHNAL